MTQNLHLQKMSQKCVGDQREGSQGSAGERRRMSRIVTVLLTLLLATTAFAETPSALITSLNGQALVITKENKASAAPLTSLAPKTLLELRGGTTMIVVFFESDSIEEYTGPALIGIGENRGKVFHGPDTARRVVKADSALVREIEPTALVHPEGSGKLSARRVSGKTELSWTADVAGPYQVSVVKPAQFGERQTQVWSKDVDTKQVVYDGPKLSEKLTYYVEVSAGETVIGVSPFRVHDGKAKGLSEAEAEAKNIKLADPKDTTGHVLMSILYSQHGLNDKAIESLNEAIKAQPEEQAFMGRMKTMMADVNKQAEDNTAYARGYYQAVDQYWGTEAYFDPYAWRWDGWDF